MAKELTDALTHLRDHRVGVLVTQRANGRPQLSNVAYAAGNDGLVRISITGDRAKYKNLLPAPVATFHVTSSDQWSYVVIDADVELSPIAPSPDPADPPSPHPPQLATPPTLGRASCRRLTQRQPTPRTCDREHDRGPAASQVRTARQLAWSFASAIADRTECTISFGRLT